MQWAGTNFLVTFLYFGLAGYGLTRRDNIIIRAFVQWQIASGILPLSLGIISSGINEDLALFLWRFNWLIISGAVVLGLRFTSLYLGYKHWWTIRRFFYFMAIPLTVQLAVLLTINHEIEHLIQDVQVVEQANLYILVTHPLGLIQHIGNAYLGLLTLINVVFIIWHIRITAPIYRIQTYLLTLAFLTPMLFVTVEVMLFQDHPLVNQIPQPNLANSRNYPFAVILASVFTALALFRYNLLDLIPLTLSSILDTVTDAIIVVNKLGTPVYANQQAYTLVAQTNIPNEDATPDLLTTVIEEINLMLTNDTSTIEFTRVISGEEQVFEVSTSDLQSRLGDNLQVITLNERTMHKELERLQLERQKHNLLSTFIEKASHEFRTPLSIIKTRQYLAQRATTPEKRIQLLGSINEQADAINSLVDTLVLMVKLDNAPQYNFATLNIAQFINEVVTAKQSFADQHNITLAVEHDETAPHVHADSYYMNIALKHLIDNAIHYSNPNNTVTITTCCQNDTLSIHIKDTGIGIAKSDLPSIFEQFFRVDRSHSTPGFGLGLNIAQTIIQAHEGTLSVQTEAGKGSVFTIKLPLA